MAKRPTRLRFTEDDLADSHVKKAADRADKAVDRAEKAADKLASKKAKPKLKLETDAAGSRKAKLRFEKAEFTEIERPSVAKHMASRGAAVTLTSKAHRAVSEYEDDNIGVQAVQETTKAVESTVYTVDHAVYSHKLKAYDKAEKLVEKSDKANVNALYEKFKKDNPDAGSNPFSRWQQKRAIKKEYAAAKAGKNTASTTASASKGAGKATGKAAQGAKNITERVTEFCTTHSKTILFVLIAGLLFMILSGMFSSCSAMFQGGTQIVLGTSFTAKEEDIIGADNDYKAFFSSSLSSLIAFCSAQFRAIFASSIVKMIYTLPFLSIQPFLADRLMRSSKMPYSILASAEIFQNLSFVNNTFGTR